MYDSIGANLTSFAGRTHREVRDVAAADGSVFVLPVGSVEQHGHHLPVATDTILVDAVANLGAERVEEDVPVLVGPPFWGGFSPHHLLFGGTMTLEFETMLAALEELVDTVLTNGFDAVVLLNGHGGNKSVIGGATSTIGMEHPETEVLGITYFDLAASFADDLRDSQAGGMAHGGEFETSLMLHLRPELVRQEAMAASNLEEHYDQGDRDLLETGPLSVYRGFDEYSNSGAIGDPTVASAEKGERFYERLGDELEALLRDVHAENSG
jgi:creatinine amidohydrolase